MTWETAACRCCVRGCDSPPSGSRNYGEWLGVRAGGDGGPWDGSVFLFLCFFLLNCYPSISVEDITCSEVEEKLCREFPGGKVVRTPYFHCLIPGREIRFGKLLGVVKTNKQTTYNCANKS